MVYEKMAWMNTATKALDPDLLKKKQIFFEQRYPLFPTQIDRIKKRYHNDSGAMRHNNDIKTPGFR